MSIDDLDEDLLRNASIHCEAAFKIGHEISRLSRNDGEPNRSKNTISVCTDFVTANFCWNPKHIGKHQFDCCVNTIHRPIQSDWWYFIAKTVEKLWI